MRRLAALVLLAFSAAVIGACGFADGGGAPVRETSTPREGGAPKAPRTASAADAAAEGAGEGEAGGFFAAAESSGGTAGAADRIRGFELRVFEGYERVLIGFGSRGRGTSGVPMWHLESPREGGYVRLRFPGVSSTETSDEDLVGLVVDAAYVVRDPRGGMFIDVFALRSFRYRVIELPKTGQLAVDFRPAEDGLEFPPTQGENSVVVQPREAEEVEDPLVVRGYCHLPEGTPNVSLLGREGEVISSRTVRTGVRTRGEAVADGAVAWEPFEARLEFSGYRGLATLRVGGERPRGTPVGVTFEGAKTEIIVE